MIQPVWVMSHQILLWGKKKKNRTKFEGRESACEWDLNREEGITHHPGQKEVGGE